MSEYLGNPLPRFRYRGKPNGLLAEAADEDGTPIKVEWVYGFLASETKYINHTGAHDYEIVQESPWLQPWDELDTKNKFAQLN